MVRFEGAAHLAGDVAVVAGRAAHLTGRLLAQYGLPGLRAEGAGHAELAEVRAAVDALLAAGEAWAKSPGGHPVAVGADMGAASGHGTTGTWLSMNEAAETLGVTPRHARRLAAGHGQQVAGRWVLPADVVNRMSDERKAV